MKLSTLSATTVYEAKWQNGYQVLSEVDFDDRVELYSAVVGKNGSMVNLEDYVGIEVDGKVKEVKFT